MYYFRILIAVLIVFFPHYLLFCKEILPPIDFRGTYQISVVDEILHGEATCINDKGQIAGRLFSDNFSRSNSFIYDRTIGMNFIEVDAPRKIMNSLNTIGYRDAWIDLKPYKTFFNGEKFSCTDLNEMGQIIGSYSPIGTSNNGTSMVDRPFIWDHGIISDIGINSAFANQLDVRLAKLGLCLNGLGLIAINNKGELVGHCWTKKFHVKKKEYVHANGYMFFWDGDFYLDNIPGNCGGKTVKLNNNGVVLITTYNDDTYLWDITRHSFQLIPSFVGVDINDSCVVLGYKDEPRETNRSSPRSYAGVPAIWENGEFTTIAELLGVEAADRISSQYTDDYTIECLHKFVGINNRRQILCHGTIWGDVYPCILEPLHPSMSH